MPLIIRQISETSPTASATWLMVIGCSLPIVVVPLLPMFGVSWGTALLFLLLLGCPLMHLFGMHGGHQHSRGEEPESPKEGA